MSNRLSKELTNKQRESRLRHQRRLLARQRKAEGRKYKSIIKQDLIGVLVTKKTNEPMIMLKID
jgi:hypothetical protein